MEGIVWSNRQRQKINQILYLCFIPYLFRKTLWEREEFRTTLTPHAEALPTSSDNVIMIYFPRGKELDILVKYPVEMLILMFCNLLILGEFCMKADNILCMSSV